MGAAILSDILTEILIPVAAIIGIVFSLVQWFLVSRVKLSPERQTPPPSNSNKNGYTDYLIEEEEGLNDHNVVLKCAEIQSAISEGFEGRQKIERTIHKGVSRAPFSCQYPGLAARV